MQNEPVLQKSYSRKEVEKTRKELHSALEDNMKRFNEMIPEFGRKPKRELEWNREVTRQYDEIYNMFSLYDDCGLSVPGMIDMVERAGKLTGELESKYR
jgi:hypothetical protein